MGDNKRIWIVSEYYYPTVTSTGYYITEIAEYLALTNNIHVICTDSTYNGTGTQSKTRNEIINGVHIHRVITRKFNKDAFIFRGIGLLLTSLKIFLKLLLNVEKGDKILAVTNPAFLFILLPLAKGIKKINYLVLVHDIFPENLAAIKKINNKSLSYRFLQKLFDYGYSRAETCIAIGRDMEAVIRQKVGEKNNIAYIPNWADTDEVYPIDKDATKLIYRLGLKDLFIFQFAGNLGHAQGLENILQTISCVDNPNLHFLFIGTGAKEKSIRDFIITNKLQNTTLIGFIDRKDQLDFLNACDVAIVTLNDGMFGLGVPSKSYNIMAAGKPIIIIADKKSEISICVEENQIGWTVEPNNPNALLEVFNKAYVDYKQIDDMKKRSRETAVKDYAKELILKKYLELLA